MASSNQTNPNSFLPADAVPGVVLVGVAILAMLVVNSPLGDAYNAILATKLTIGPEGFSIEMKAAYWIKNGLMAVFFFFVGLELKRELVEGQLSSVKAAALPAIGALGGMICPALAFVVIAGPAGFGHGWAIPAATDIAFALGVVSLLGSRVPLALKAFLLAVAVVDDLGAILIVALFYSSGIAVTWLASAAVLAVILALLAWGKITNLWIYGAIFLLLWIALQNSGVSPTLAGVIVAAAIPINSADESKSLLHKTEHSLRPWVMFGVMPVFAFANAGVSFNGVGDYLLHPITLGIFIGLFLGKPIGITLFSFIGAKLLKMQLPGTLPQVVGVGLIAGVGFTMSLFIGALAFQDEALATPVRLGVYFGSVSAAIFGFVLLALTLPKVRVIADEEDQTDDFIG